MQTCIGSANLGVVSPAAVPRAARSCNLDGITIRISDFLEQVYNSFAYDGFSAASFSAAMDVIISVDGMNLDCDAFVDRIASSASGESLTLGIYRQGQALEITLTVGEQIQSQAPQVSTAPALSEDPELLPRNRKSGTVPSGKAH